MINIGSWPFSTVGETCFDVHHPKPSERYDPPLWTTGGGHEAARVHYPDRRLGGGVAAKSAGSGLVMLSASHPGCDPDDK